MEFHENKAKTPFIRHCATLAGGEDVGGGKCRPDECYSR